MQGHMQAFIDRKDGHAVAKYFKRESLSSLIHTAISAKPYDELLKLQQQLLSSTDIQDQYRQSSNVLLAFLRFFSASEDNWDIPVFKVLCHNCYLYAMESREYEDCARVLLKAFTTTVTDRSSLGTSKKWATLSVVVLLFKVYFRLDNYRLCHNVLRVIENPQLEFPEIGQFPLAEQVTFRYYRGRIHIHQNEFKEAEMNLSTALDNCHSSSFKNARLILSYLIVVMILRGRFPKESLLLKYKLKQQYFELTNAVVQGNLVGFTKSLQDNLEFFMRLELYLILQVKLKNLLYRNLLKRMYTLLN